MNTLIDRHRAVRRLRQWLARVEPTSENTADSDFGRMTGWAKERLARLEATIEPERIDQDLTKKGLFPEADELYDPEGDPPHEPHQR